MYVCMYVCTLFKVDQILALQDGIVVVMDFDCYTGDSASIPTHGDSLGK